MIEMISGHDLMGHGVKPEKGSALNEESAYLSFSTPPPAYLLSLSQKKINKSLKKIKISDLLFGCKSTWSFGGNKIECVELDYGGSWWFQWVLTHSRKGRKGGIIVLTENNPMKLTWLSDSANNILYLH